MSPVRIDNYDQIVAAINKKYEGTLHRGNEQMRYQSISTGSPELDIAMGGGVPQGRWTRFYGGYASTKTMTALAVMGNAQRMGLTCALYNVEKRYTADFAEHLGVCTGELTVVEGTTVEEIADKMESLLGVVHVHVIDSCSIAVSEDELAADVRDWRPGITARAWGKAFRRLNERFDQESNTVILIDQMRSNFKTQGEDPAGGRIFDHQSSMSVLFRRGSWLFRNKDGWLDEKGTEDKKAGLDEQIVPAGIEIKIRVEKSSVCRPFRTATLHYDLDTVEYDRVYEYVKAAKYYGVVEPHGTWYWWKKRNGEVVKLQGDKQLREFIATNPIFRKIVHKTAVEAALR
jgi:RecA/RadA recombinase